MGQICSREICYDDDHDDDDGGVDLISRLPDEILISILSRLNNMEETVRTSVLSSRWRKLWTYIPVLNFDSLHRVAKIMPLPWDAYPLLIQMCNAYISWVNSVLASHAPDAKAIDEIRIHFCYSDKCANGISHLISFAIQNNVRTFELDLPPFQNPLMTDDCFILERLHFLSSGGTLCFRVLRFNQLDMSDDVLNYILLNSPCLKKLNIFGASSLMNVKITGPSSSSLKYFEMSDCPSVGEVVISQTFLECLKVSNMYPTKLVLNNLPQLVDVQLGHLVSYTVNEIPIVFSCCLEQIRKLVAIITIEKHGVSPELAMWPTFSNLRHLELSFRIGRGTNFCPLVSFLEACPMMQTLKLKYACSYDLKESVRSVPERKAPQVALKNNSFRSLKVLELKGYVGDTEDAELVAFVVENAKSLNKLIVTMADLTHTHIESEYLEREKQLTEDSAVQLKSKIPFDAEFLLTSSMY